MCILRDHVRASYPLIWVTTLEPQRFVTSEVKTLSEMDKKCFTWDLTDGLRPLNFDGDKVECDPNEVLQHIKVGIDDGIYFLSNYGHFLKSPVNGEVDIVNIQSMVNLIPWLKTKRCMVVVVSPSLSLPDELEREFTVLEHTMPNVEALAGIIKHIVDDNGLPMPSAEDLDKIAFAGKGLTVGEFEDVSALSLVRTKKFCPLTIAEQKAQMVKKTAGLQITKFKESFADLGGYENLKTWTLNRFQRRKLKLGSESLPFRGILLLGVPGAGKTLFGKALGHEVGWPCVILNLGELFGSLVGQSEERARRVFATIDSMAPVIVFLDEIDKGLSGVKSSGSTDSGVGARVGEVVLKWMNEPTGDTFVIATANSIEGLPPEYLRAGRWDGIFFVDVPSAKEQKDILSIYLKKYHNMKIEDLSEFPDITHFTGAEIKQLCIEAAYNGSDWFEAANYVKPIAVTRKMELNKLRKWAETNCIPASSPVKIKPVKNGTADAHLQDFCRMVNL